MQRMFIQSPTTAAAAIEYVVETFAAGAYSELYDLDLSRPVVERLSALGLAGRRSLANQHIVHSVSIKVEVLPTALTDMVAANAPSFELISTRQGRFSRAVISALMDAGGVPSDGDGGGTVDLSTAPPELLAFLENAHVSGVLETLHASAISCGRPYVQEFSIMPALESAEHAARLVADEELLIRANAPLQLCSHLCGTTRYTWLKCRKQWGISSPRGPAEHLSDLERERVRVVYTRIKANSSSDTLTGADCLALARKTNVSLRVLAPLVLRWSR